MTMKKGKRALLRIRPDYGFGELEVERDFATAPPSSTLVCEIEMVDFVKVINLYLEISKLFVVVYGLTLHNNDLDI